MIVKMVEGSTEEQADRACQALQEAGLEVQNVRLPYGRFLVGMGQREGEKDGIGSLPGVEWVITNPSGPVLAALERNPGGSVISLGASRVGGEDLAIIAGPCSVEDKEQLQSCARFVAAYGATALRGGAYKPRTSPYAFQGLGVEGLDLLKAVGQAVRLPVVSEVMEPGDVELMASHVECLQVGARSMQNFPLLRAVGRSGKPVLLKRGPAAGISEFVLAAEYILVQGNPNVILCERGIRTFESATRNTLDLNAVPVLKSRTHLPVIVDPSHGTGRTDAVIPMARAAVAAGADGIIVEVHPDPCRALCDGDQSLTPDQFRRLVEELKPVAEAVGRKVQIPGEARGGEIQATRSRRALGWGAAG